MYIVKIYDRLQSADDLVKGGRVGDLDDEDYEDLLDCVEDYESDIFYAPEPFQFKNKLSFESNNSWNLDPLPTFSRVLSMILKEFNKTPKKPLPKLTKL